MSSPKKFNKLVGMMLNLRRRNGSRMVLLWKQSRWLGVPLWLRLKYLSFGIPRMINNERLTFNYDSANYYQESARNRLQHVRYGVRGWG